MAAWKDRHFFKINYEHNPIHQSSSGGYHRRKKPAYSQRNESYKAKHSGVPSGVPFKNNKNQTKMTPSERLKIIQRVNAAVKKELNKTVIDDIISLKAKYEVVLQETMNETQANILLAMISEQEGI